MDGGGQRRYPPTPNTVNVVIFRHFFVASRGESFKKYSVIFCLCFNDAVTPR